jgi:hypothetical protein
MDSVVVESPRTGPIFLSYAAADRDRPLAMADALEAAGVPVWIDRRGIAGGDLWAAEISSERHHRLELEPALRGFWPRLGEQMSEPRYSQLVAENRELSCGQVLAEALAPLANQPQSPDR